MTTTSLPTAASALLLLAAAFVIPTPQIVHSFVFPTSHNTQLNQQDKCPSPLHQRGLNRLNMSNLDPVTYLRTEWVSAALCTNQTPRSADKVVQLGTEDGRIVNFVPRTVREIVTSSAEGRGEGLTVSCVRGLKQMAEKRNSAKIVYSNQPADDLVDTPSSTVDIVISLQSAQRMHENGLDWKKSIREAGRVLKPGGRFLFCESKMIENEDYLEFLLSLSGDIMDSGGEDTVDGGVDVTAATEGEMSDGTEAGSDDDKSPLFEEVGYDDVDMVLQPHIAGVAVKAMDADLTSKQLIMKKNQEEEDRMAELSLNAFERGNKRRRRKKKKGAGFGLEENE